jgi:hypothetical protein
MNNVPFNKPTLTQILQRYQAVATSGNMTARESSPMSIDAQILDNEMVSPSNHGVPATIRKGSPMQIDR